MSHRTDHPMTLHLALRNGIINTLTIATGIDRAVAARQVDLMVNARLLEEQYSTYADYPDAEYYDPNNNFDTRVSRSVRIDELKRLVDGSDIDVKVPKL